MVELTAFDRVASNRIASRLPLQEGAVVLVCEGWVWGFPRLDGDRLLYGERSFQCVGDMCVWLGKVSELMDPYVLVRKCVAWVVDSVGFTCGWIACDWDKADWDSVERSGCVRLDGGKYGVEVVKRLRGVAEDMGVVLVSANVAKYRLRPLVMYTLGGDVYVMKDKDDSIAKELRVRKLILETGWMRNKVANKLYSLLQLKRHKITPDDYGWVWMHVPNKNGVRKVGDEYESRFVIHVPLPPVPTYPELLMRNTCININISMEDLNTEPITQEWGL